MLTQPIKWHGGKHYLAKKIIAEMPPHVHYEMSEAEHFSLLRCLASIKGKFLLSGYHSDLYDDLAKASSWRLVEIPIDNKASSAKTKEIKTECLWMNYDL